VLGPAGGRLSLQGQTPVRPSGLTPGSPRIANGIALARHIWGNAATPLARLAVTTLPPP